MEADQVFASTELPSFANMNFSQGGSGIKWGMCAFGRCCEPSIAHQALVFLLSPVEESGSSSNRR